MALDSGWGGVVYGRADRPAWGHGPDLYPLPATNPPRCQTPAPLSPVCMLDTGDTWMTPRTGPIYLSIRTRPGGRPVVYGPSPLEMGEPHPQTHTSLMSSVSEPGAPVRPSQTAPRQPQAIHSSQRHFLQRERLPWHPPIAENSIRGEVWYVGDAMGHGERQV